MSSAAVSTHSGTGALSLMSCVRESSPLQDFDSDTEKNVATKKKFWNRIKWFKRKNKVIEDNILPVSDYIQTNESLRSRSTSELSIEEPPRKRTGSSMYPGISVSHDSVFHSPHSGSETDLDVAHSSSSLYISGNSQPQADLQTELSERLRLRRSGNVGREDTSEDDEGLPHSPCNSPTTTDTLLDKTAIKDLPNKSHSTCSDGSLLSEGSLDIEEDLLLTKNSSKSSPSDFDLNASSAPLNHSAAHHRVAVRPKKTHGVPRRKRIQVVELLPTTIEVNEDLHMRASSPEFDDKVAPGVDDDDDDGKLNRSRSNASNSKSQDGLEEQHKEEKCSFFERLFPRRSAKKKKSKSDDKKQEEKKMKFDEKKHEDLKNQTNKFSWREDNHISNYTVQSLENSYRKYDIKPIPAVRSGAVYRQRMIPIDVPDRSEETKNDEEEIINKNQLPDILSTSPLQIELESKLKQRLTTSPSPSKSFEQQDNVDNHRSKIKLAGLSSLQQKVLNLNEEEETHHNYKSLIEFPSSPQKSNILLTKSQSFKNNKIPANHSATVISNRTTNSSEEIGKSTSMDSIKIFDEGFQKIERTRKIKKQTVELEYDTENVDNLDEQITTHLMETKRLCDNITISGPSHTAVVNVYNNNTENVRNIDNKTVEISTTTRENSISVTKINVQHPENEEITIDLLETKPLKIPEQIKTKPIFNFDTKQPIQRKFSKENVEIIDRDEKENESPKTSPVFFPPTSPSPTTPLFKKNVQKKPSVVSITSDSSMKDDKSSLTSYYKSSSLDSLISDNLDSTDKSSQDSLDNVIDKQTKNDNVILRKKASVKRTKDEEPELMKVFARRSLKLKDSENESLSQQLSVMLMMNENCDKTRDSDKENQTDSPIKERRKSLFEIENQNEEIIKKPLTFELEKKDKEPLIESNLVHSKPITIRRTENNINSSLIDQTEIVLRKPENSYQQRSISINSIDNSQNILRKQFISRRKTDNWITSNIKNEDGCCDDEEKKNSKENEENLNLIIETKNFNQKKAEWEKRAQEAQKKSTP